GSFAAARSGLNNGGSVLSFTGSASTETFRVGFGGGITSWVVCDRCGKGGGGRFVGFGGGAFGDGACSGGDGGAGFDMGSEELLTAPVDSARLSLSRASRSATEPPEVVSISESMMFFT